MQGQDPGRRSSQKRHSGQGYDEAPTEAEQKQQAPAQAMGGLYKQAAYEVLRTEERLMTTGEITRIAMERGLLRSAGKTPENTMASALYTEVRKKASTTAFIKPKEGLFGLRTWLSAAWLINWLTVEGISTQDFVQAAQPVSEAHSGGAPTKRKRASGTPAPVPYALLPSPQQHLQPLQQHPQQQPVAEGEPHAGITSGMMGPRIVSSRMPNGMITAAPSGAAAYASQLHGEGNSRAPILYRAPQHAVAGYDAIGAGSLPLPGAVHSMLLPSGQTLVAVQAHIADMGQAQLVAPSLAHGLLQMPMCAADHGQLQWQAVPMRHGPGCSSHAQLHAGMTPQMHSRQAGEGAEGSAMGSEAEFSNLQLLLDAADEIEGSDPAEDPASASNHPTSTGRGQHADAVYASERRSLSCSGTHSRAHVADVGSIQVHAPLVLGQPPRDCSNDWQGSLHAGNHPSRPTDVGAGSMQLHALPQSQRAAGATLSKGAVFMSSMPTPAQTQATPGFGIASTSAAAQPTRSGHATLSGMQGSQPSLARSQSGYEPSGTGSDSTAPHGVQRQQLAQQLAGRLTTDLVQLLRQAGVDMSPVSDLLGSMSLAAHALAPPVTSGFLTHTYARAPSSLPARRSTLSEYEGGLSVGDAADAVSSPTRMPPPLGHGHGFVHGSGAMQQHQSLHGPQQHAEMLHFQRQTASSSEGHSNSQVLSPKSCGAQEAQGPHTHASQGDMPYQMASGSHRCSGNLSFIHGAMNGLVLSVQPSRGRASVPGDASPCMVDVTTRMAAGAERSASEHGESPMLRMATAGLAAASAAATSAVHPHGQEEMLCVSVSDVECPVHAVGTGCMPAGSVFASGQHRDHMSTGQGQSTRPQLQSRVSSSSIATAAAALGPCRPPRPKPLGSGAGADPCATSSSGDMLQGGVLPLFVPQQQQQQQQGDGMQPAAAT